MAPPQRNNQQICSTGTALHTSTAFLDQFWKAKRGKKKTKKAPEHGPLPIACGHRWESISDKPR
ncbi:hypothetical protein BDM02DRAFT_3110785 [Thelephora ganbajun]|uniref:Uncharacterized protein n=1 Tax=Thelephora ganbajun TaxID=370292 RepID=A0ACB6ZP97_THEGA|nr:hypothetical protein BDM02DRAFT_3110785 [Thelephora ganbajun]